MRIEFQNIEYKNFMSSGNHGIKIDLNRSPSTLLTGRNGSGKSMVLQALSYVCYGKLVSTKMNIPDAINNINKKAMLVKVTFKKGEDVFTVIRGEKPKKFELIKNGESQHVQASASERQQMIESILGVDFKAFLQNIVLDSDRFTPFMETTAAERRKVVDDVLGTSLYSAMGEHAKVAQKSLQREITNIESDSAMLKVEIKSIQSSIDVFEKQIEDSKTDIRSDVEANDKEIESLTDTMKRLDKERNELVMGDSVDDKIRQLEKVISESQYKIKETMNLSKFYIDNDDCPTCDRPLDPEIKQREIDKVNETTALMNERIQKTRDFMQPVLKKKEELDQIKETYRKLTNEINLTKSKIVELINRNKKLEEKVKDVVGEDKLIELGDQLVEKEVKLQELDSIHSDLLKKIESYNRVISMLGDDGIKQLIIKEYLPFFNKKVNEYIQAMGFYVGLVFDEGFNEKFTNTNKEGFKYGNLSKGQRLRMNLSIWLALLELASMKNSMVTNILCLDEILEPFDPEGVVDFMKLSDNLLIDKNMFVVTQRGDEFEDLFRSKIEFVLKDDFTEIVA